MAVLREVLVAVVRHALRGSTVQAVGDLESALEAARDAPLDAVLLGEGLVSVDIDLGEDDRPVPLAAEALCRSVSPRGRWSS